MGNKEAIDAWRARREKRMSAKEKTNRDAESGTWVTMKGTHVLIDDGGNIKNKFSDKSAEERLHGKNMKEIDKNKTESTADKRKRIYGPISLSDEIVDMAAGFQDRLADVAGKQGEKAGKNREALNAEIGKMVEDIKKSTDYRNTKSRLDKTDWAEPFAEAIGTSLPSGSTLQIGDTSYELREQKPSEDGFSYPVWYGDDGSKMETDVLAWRMVDHLKRGGDKGSIRVTSVGKRPAPKREWRKKMSLEEYMND